MILMPLDVGHLPRIIFSFDADKPFGDEFDLETNSPIQNSDFSPVNFLKRNSLQA
jgi:hypothetical protein